MGTTAAQATNIIPNLHDICFGFTERAKAAAAGSRRGAEAVRFADRLEVRIDIPDAARSALVPSLVLQPLIENVVKHSVSTSTAPITLDISARVESGRLHVCIRNSAGDGPGQGARGTGVGLNNVAERLRARFGEDCAFRAEPQPDGGFAVSFAIPWSDGTS